MKIHTDILLIIIFLCLAPSGYVLNAQSYQDAQKKKVDVFETEKIIAINAQLIAQKRLAKDTNDKTALTLVALANHLYPTYEPLLLLRAKLKYKLPITEPSKQKLTETEFTDTLKKRALALEKSTNVRDMHLRLVYYSIIRLFLPEDDKTLIELMKFSDLGKDMDLTKLLQKKFSSMPFNELDPKDQRYAIGNVEKTIKVYAREPWTDSWIKVKEGQIVRLTASRFWTLGSGTFPYIDADGFDNLDLTTMTDKGNSGKHDKNYQTKFRPPKFATKKLLGKKGMQPGCLLAKIGNSIYPAGREVTFKAESSGILSLGPFEWESYNDNDGYLLVKITISDK